MPFNKIALFPALLLATIITSGCTGRLLSESRNPATVQTDTFIMVSVASGDTYASLADTYLKDKRRYWQISALNENRPLSAGQRIIIPLVPLAYGGLRQDGYQTVPVLRYTELASAPTDAKILSAHKFDSQLDYLSANGFTVVSLDQFYAFLELKDQLPPKAIVISLDTTAAWAYEIAYPALKQRGMKSVLFISPGEVGRKGYLTWPQLAEMAGTGVEIGLYGPKIETPAKADAKAFLESLEAKLVDPQKAFLHHLKQPCRYFAYYQGQSNDLLIALLKKHGYRAAFTRKRGSNPFFTDNFKIKRSTIYGGYDLARFEKNLTTFHSAELK